MHLLSLVEFDGTPSRRQGRERQYQRTDSLCRLLEADVLCLQSLMEIRVFLGCLDTFELPYRPHAFGELQEELERLRQIGRAHV